MLKGVNQFQHFFLSVNTCVSKDIGQGEFLWENSNVCGSGQLTQTEMKQNSGPFSAFDCFSHQQEQDVGRRVEMGEQVPPLPRVLHMMRLPFVGPEVQDQYNVCPLFAFYVWTSSWVSQQASAYVDTHMHHKPQVW